MKARTTEKWERDQINALTLKMILLATLSTAAAGAIAFLLQKMGLPEVRPELLFMPWGIVLVVGVSISFRAGVNAERARRDGSGAS